METTRNFKLTDESIELSGGQKLFRIRATREISRHFVKAGDRGGFVEKVENIADDALVAGNAQVAGNSQVTGVRDVLAISTIGSEDVHVTLAKSANGHILNVGCWTGTVETLMEEVERRKENHWHGSEQRNKRLHKEYEALHLLLKNRVEEWEEML